MIDFGLQSGDPVLLTFLTGQVEVHLHSETFSHEHHSLFSPTVYLFIKLINPIYLIFVIKFSYVRYPEIVFDTTLCKLTFRYSAYLFLVIGLLTTVMYVCVT